MLFKNAALILTTLFLAACTRHPPPASRQVIPLTAEGKQLQGMLIDMRTQRVVSFATLVNAVAHATVVAVGEEHHHPGIQAFELRLLRALAQQRPHHLALSMEFLERDQQSTVDAYLAKAIDQETFQKRLKVSSSFMQHYFPLVRYARQARLPIVAMNAPRRIARQVAKHGLLKTLEGLSVTDRAYIPAALAAISERYRTYFLKAVADYHPLTDDQAERFVEASHLKDATMATALTAFLAQHPDFTVLAIAGRFHFDYGIAIPALLQQDRRNVVIQRITTMAVDPDSTFDLHRLAEDAVADYLHFFPPAPDEKRSASTGSEKSRKTNTRARDDGALDRVQEKL
ncbi:MAG: ChaN family lipoprotein [Candidatus Tectomicrobia bacterium]